MRPLRAAIVVALVVAVSACEGDPGADLRSRRPVGESPSDAGGTTTTGGASVSFDPPASDAGVARVVRIRLGAPSAALADRAILVDGNLSPSQLRDVARGVVSQTVAARRVDLLAWSDPADARTIVAHPLRPLTAGHAYTLAGGPDPVAASFVVATEQPLAMLRRVWPIPRDATASPRFAVYCGQAPLTMSARVAAFEPGPVDGAFAPGIGASTDAPACVRWTAQDGTALVPPIVPPPTLQLDDTVTVLLDPSPLAGSGAAPPLAQQSCRPAEVALAVACLAVDDDRLIVSPGPATALVAVWAGGTSQVAVPKLGERFVVRPLEPGTSVEVRGAMIDATGRVTEDAVTVTTAAAHAHVVIDEVYAHPNGPEPSEEWIELLNDGAVPAQLGGMAVETGGASTVLPSAVLDPGGFALVVRDTFSADDGVDPPPASGSLVVRVPKLGKAGMSNEGAEVLLRDGEGNVISRFAASPKPKKGVSVIRVAPAALDENASSFAYDPNGSATPGAPNPAMTTAP